MYPDPGYTRALGIPGIQVYQGPVFTRDPGIPGIPFALAPEIRDADSKNSDPDSKKPFTHVPGNLASPSEDM